VSTWPFHVECVGCSSKVEGRFASISAEVGRKVQQDARDRGWVQIRTSGRWICDACIRHVLVEREATMGAS